MTFNDQKLVIGLLKAGASQTPEQRAAYKRKREPLMPWAYPDYGKSIVSRMKQDPHKAGLLRGAEFGSLGALLGLLAGRLATRDPMGITAAALGGAALGGIPGYISGSDEAKSNYSKLLFLRRLGVRTPGEDFAMRELGDPAGDVVMKTEKAI